MNQQQYQEWLDNRDAIIEKLKIELDASTGEALDFTPQSLQMVGAYLVDHFASLAELHRPENRSQHLGFSTYVFEVFRRNLGLEPHLPQDDPKYEYFGVPVLRFPDGRDISPFDLVTFTVHRRDPALLATVYANQPEQTAEDSSVANKADGSVNSSPSRVPDCLKPISEEDFTSWLTFLTDQLEGFFSTLDDKTRQRLDFSPESLKFVGELVVARSSGNEGMALDDDLICDLYSYIGEVFHRNLGVQFFLPKDEKEPAFGQPSIRDASGSTISLPQIVVETARRQDPNFIFETFKRIRDDWILAKGPTKI